MDALMTQLLQGSLLGHISSVFEASVYCAMGDTHLEPQAMKHYTSHNLLLEAAPTVSPDSSSREHICSSHKTVTQSLSLPTEKQINTHQHSCSCNLVPFLEPLAALSTVSTRLPNPAVGLWIAGSCSHGAGVTLLGPQPLQKKAVAQVTRAHQHYLLCSASFKFQPGFCSSTHWKHPSSFSHTWQGGSIHWGMFFPLVSSDKGNQKPQPRTWSSSHPTSSKLNFGQVRKCSALF